MRIKIWWMTALVCAAACSEDIEKAKQAAEAAKGLMQMAEGAKQAAEAAEKAAAEAEAVAAADTEGMDPEKAKEQIDMAKGIAAMRAMQEAAGGGPAVNWRQLKPFLPDELGGFKASRDLKGSTNKAGGMQVTEVSRTYEAGESRLDISITDAFTAPMLKAPFAMAAMIEEDSSEGFKKGKKIKGHTAIVEWRESAKRSQASVLVAGRFMLSVNISKTDDTAAAEKIVAAMDLDALAGVKAETEEPEAPAE